MKCNWCFRPWHMRKVTVTVWRELGEHRATYPARSTLFRVISPVQVPARVRALGGESKGRLVYSEYPIKSIAVLTIFHFHSLSIAVLTIFHFHSLVSITMSNPDIHWVFTIQKSALRLTSQGSNPRWYLDQTDNQK